MILLMGRVGNVCDMGELSLLPSKNNIGVWRLWAEKWERAEEEVITVGLLADRLPSLKIHTGNWD